MLKPPSSAALRRDSGRFRAIRGANPLLQLLPFIIKAPQTLSTYRPPPWLLGAHAQTIWPFLFKGRLPPYRRERWETPDGDFIDLDWLDTPALPTAPLVILFHGLEGSSHSHYARGLMQAIAARGWRGVVPHFRGCSGEPNRLPRAYHSGDSAEIDWILRRFAALHGQGACFAAGVSLGGNALLKWLGEREDAACGVIDAAAAICPPLDLAVSGHALARGFNRVYSLHFLATLRNKALAKLAQTPDLFSAERVRTARSLFEFDDAYTGPVHGYAGAEDYWRRASSRPWLGGIRVPTLLLTAANDPFVPPAALPTAADLSPAVRHEHPADGGHVGFHGVLQRGLQNHAESWMAHRVLSFFSPHLPADVPIAPKELTTP